MNEISPCPYCSTKTRAHSLEDPTDGVIYWHVECTFEHCEACGPWELTEAEAVWSWERMTNRERQARLDELDRTVKIAMLLACPDADCSYGAKIGQHHPSCPSAKINGLLKERTAELEKA